MSRKSEQELMNEDISEEQIEIEPIPKGNIANLEEQLFRNYTIFQDSKKELSKLAQTINKLSFCLSLLWRELVPDCASFDTINDVKFPKNFLLANPNIQRGSFNVNISMCGKNQGLFWIYLNGQKEGEMPHEQDLKFLKEISEEYLIFPLKKSIRNYKYLKSIFTPQEFLSNSSQLIFCRFNILHEIVVFGQVGIDIDRETFRLIVEQMIEQEKQYDKMEKSCERRYWRQKLKRELQMLKSKEKKKDEKEDDNTNNQDLYE